MARRTLLRRLIVKCRLFWADIRGHHGKVWNYEPGDYYMGSHKGHKKHENRKHEKGYLKSKVFMRF